MHSTRRFLVVTFNASGNWPPELALVRALVQRGHDVRVLADTDLAAQITEAGATYCPYHAVAPRDVTIRHNTPGESELDRVLRVIYLNPKYSDDLLAAVACETPDVLLVDSMLMTAAAAAEHTRLLTAALWLTAYGARMANPLPMSAPVLAPLNALREQMGLAGVTDWRGSVEKAHAILALTYEAFDTAPPGYTPTHLHYVGPLACLPQSLPPYPLPWPPEDERPLVLVSYSTGFQNQGPVLQRLAEAVAPLPVRVLLTLGHRITADELRLPPNVVAETFVPHAAVLAQTRLVVTHAGHGTVMAATTAGVPMVCTPMGRDQYAVSSCVERLGLGRVASMTASPEALRQTLVAALADEAMHTRAHLCRWTGCRSRVGPSPHRAGDVAGLWGVKQPTRDSDHQEGVAEPSSGADGKKAGAFSPPLTRRPVRLHRMYPYIIGGHRGKCQLCATTRGCNVVACLHSHGGLTALVGEGACA